METNVRSRTSVLVDVPDSTGTIHPFLVSNKSIVKALSKELSDLFQERKAKRIVVYMVINVFCSTVLLSWCSVTNSMALTAYSYLTIFDIFSLLTCLISVWVKRKPASPIFSFGTLLAQLGSFFIIKESVERIVEQPEVHTGRLLYGLCLAFCFHMVLLYSLENTAFDHVIAASSSSWLQEHVADMSESLCHVVPGLSKLLLPRINPFALIAFAGGLGLCITYLLIDINEYHSADTWSAIWIALVTFGTMTPMTVYTGKILLQTTPSHMLGQLDKCLREASTLDGVLEFRSEHLWTLAFGSMAGSVHVRVRRDADEQMVLAHVYNRLANLVSVLTVQVFKDDWSRPPSYHVLGDAALLPQTDRVGAVTSALRPPLAQASPSAVRAVWPPGQSLRHGGPGSLGPGLLETNHSPRSEGATPRPPPAPPASSPFEFLSSASTTSSTDSATRAPSNGLAPNYARTTNHVVGIPQGGGVTLNLSH